MNDFQREKEVVLNHYQALEHASVAELEAVFTASLSPDCLWRGYHPFYEHRGPRDIAGSFWASYKRSFSRMQRRQDIFFAGRNEMDGFASVWVVSMGHLLGLFDADWLGIPATCKMAMLRYCEFNRIEDGRIAETAMYFDVPHLMMQAGLNPFPHATAIHMVQPGPVTHAGLCYDRQDSAEGEKTLQAINAMISGLGNWDNALSLEEELALAWHDDMIWWGPTGIGATYTIERYAKQHSGPFRAAFSDRVFNGHVARLAEGECGGFFGWPNLTMTLSGEFMGYPANGKRADMRVIDIYRRDGDKLAENWIFIDLLHFWHQHGIDILGDITGHSGASN